MTGPQDLKTAIFLSPRGCQGVGGCTLFTTPCALPPRAQEKLVKIGVFDVRVDFVLHKSGEQTVSTKYLLSINFCQSIPQGTYEYIKISFLKFSEAVSFR